MAGGVIFDIETTGLEPIVDRVICISVMDIDSKVVFTFIDLDEKKVLTDFWNFVKSNKMLYGFNTDCFDTPFIHVRSLINDVKVEDVYMSDLRSVLYSYHRNAENKFKKGRLADFARHFGMEVKTSNGLEVISNWQKGDLESIKAHCEEDIFITHVLFKRMKEKGFIL